MENKQASNGKMKGERGKEGERSPNGEMDGQTKGWKRYSKRDGETK